MVKIVERSSKAFFLRGKHLRLILAIGLGQCACSPATSFHNVAPDRSKQPRPSNENGRTKRPVFATSSKAKAPVVVAQNTHESDPLTTKPEWIELPISQHKTALVVAPQSRKQVHSLWVITHGAGGHARKHCELWHRILGDRVFLLCIHGTPMFPSGRASDENRYFYRGHIALQEEVQQAVAALRKRFGKVIDPSATTYAGYSQGASMGARFLPDSELAFKHVILVEGGVGRYGEWSLLRAQQLRRRGTQRIALVCGRPRCHQRASKTLALLQKAGLSAQRFYARGAGHSYQGVMLPTLRRASQWIFEQADGSKPPASR